MAEYRVTALHYRFESELDHDRFDEAESQSGTLGDWTYTLESGHLTATPRVEFRDRRAARDDLESHLRAWEQGAFLSPERHQIRFEYDRSEVEDADPQPGAVNVFPDTITIKTQTFAPTVTRGNRSYPEPGSGFQRSPLSDRLVLRLKRLRDQQAELPAVAYYVLDTLEHEFGGDGARRRERAASVLGVDPGVLRKLGELTATPDPEIGRKAGSTPRALTAVEREWIDATLVRLVRRVGERAASPEGLPRITMADLPPLS
jgi:hypothetical protein